MAEIVFKISLALLLILANKLHAQTFETKIVSLSEKVPYDVSAQEFQTLDNLQKLADGSTLIKSAKNGYASLNLLIRANSRLDTLSVRLRSLENQNNKIIQNRASAGDDLFNFTDRPFEIFVARYLEIKGLSKLSYESYYDERHAPEKFRRSYSSNGKASGKWSDRPHANRLYPDILVPSEILPYVQIEQGRTQSFIIDIFVSKQTSPGRYNGAIEILQNGKVLTENKISLDVLSFELPDNSAADSMLYIENSDIAKRYLGTDDISSAAQQEKLDSIIDNHFKLARRHGIRLFNRNEGYGISQTQTNPAKSWNKRLDGSLYSSRNGYAGPAENLADKLYVIAPYGSWPGKDNPQVLQKYATGWQQWAEKNPVEAIFYLQDESENWPEQENWARTIKQVAPDLKIFLTAQLPKALNNLKSVDIVASWFNFGLESEWKHAINQWQKTGRQFYLYNGKRPLTGSFATEDDGSALRALSWSQFKLGIKRWFFWNGTYYNNYQGGQGQTNVFKTAQTFGKLEKQDPVFGETGWNYSNGDGLLFYPGTEKIFPKESYELSGPIASLRLKLWRTGIEDVKYISLAGQKNPKATSALIEKMLPHVLWEVGVDDPSDPTWKNTDISWSSKAREWDLAREKLIKLILEHQ